MQTGSEGELLALRFEKSRLKKIGIPNPENHIEHSSKEIGDGLGYDITSVDESLTKIYIEVKTTTVSNSTDILLTRNEYLILHQLKEKYFIYHIDCSNTKKAIIKRLDFKQITENFQSIPESFRLVENENPMHNIS